MQFQKIFELLPKYIFVARKKRGCGFLHSKPLSSSLSSDDAIEIELSDWLVNQDYVICNMQYVILSQKKLEKKKISGKRSNPSSPTKHLGKTR